MGSGKSTLGKKLATKLGWHFIDMDQKIEEQTGEKISDIFTLKGEEIFRNTETELLKAIDKQINTVVSTGGGVPCFNNNMDYMNETGLTIYLKLTPSQLGSRLSGSSGRPLLNELEGEKLIQYIEEKLSHREKWYSQATLVVDGLDINTSSLISLIKNSLKF
jgi:shikimate kinase